jgi:hypothetical protein
MSLCWTPAASASRAPSGADVIDIVEVRRLLRELKGAGVAQRFYMNSATWRAIQQHSITYIGDRPETRLDALLGTPVIIDENAYDGEVHLFPPPSRELPPRALPPERLWRRALKRIRKALKL